MRESNVTTVEPVGFERAEELARTSVSETSMTEPMVVAYYDASSGRAGPEPACRGESQEAVLSYAEGHDATWRVDVNGKYVFYLRTTPVGTVTPEPAVADGLHGSGAESA